jgi:hypothetical protein
VGCGVVLDGPQKYCSDCRRAYQTREVKRAHAALRRRRVLGSDPAHGGAARKKRATANSALQKANIEWERAHPDLPDPEEFQTSILPGLWHMRVADLARATGLSWVYCSMIKKGKYVPRPRHWEALLGVPVS